MWSHLSRIRFARPLALVVALLPVPIVAPTAQTGSVRATVLDASGTPVGAALVIVVGTAIGASTNSAGVAVLLNVPAGVRTVEARRTGYCVLRQVVTVLVGQTVSVTLGCADVVIPTNAPTSQLIGVLGAATDATGSLVCRSDLVMQGVGRLQVQGNVALTDAEISEVLMRALIHRRVSLVAKGIGDVLLIGSVQSAATLRIKQFLTSSERRPASPSRPQH